MSDTEVSSPLGSIESTRKELDKQRRALEQKFKLNEVKSDTDTRDLAFVIYSLTLTLDSFLDEYGWAIKILNRTVKVLTTVIICSIFPVVLYILWTVYKILSTFWKGSSDDTKFSSLWAIPLLIISVILTHWWDTRKKK